MVHGDRSIVDLGQIFCLYRVHKDHHKEWKLRTYKPFCNFKIVWSKTKGFYAVIVMGPYAL
ncbi:hypothetical protein JCM16307_20030 [Thermococcus prieurii]